MASITIDIQAPYRRGKPAPWLGLNEYIDACRANPYKGAKFKKTYTDIARTAALEAKVKQHWKAPAGRVKVVCIWHELTRRRDPDNIAGGIKFVLDGLVEAGIIANDSQRYIEGMPVHILSYEPPAGVRVIITTEEQWVMHHGE